SVTACFVIDSPALHPPLHSFPTRRSSDLHTVEGHRPAVAVTHPSGCQYCSHGSYRAPSADVWVVTSRHPAEMTNVNRGPPAVRRSEEHTSELQSRENLVCRLLLEKKNNID